VEPAPPEVVDVVVPEFDDESDPPDELPPPDSEPDEDEPDDEEPDDEPVPEPEDDRLSVL
jgi:hypothetical protein